MFARTALLAAFAAAAATAGVAHAQSVTNNYSTWLAEVGGPAAVTSEFGANNSNIDFFALNGGGSFTSNVPLTVENWAPYGQVISASGDFATHNPSPPVSVTLYPSGVADFGFQLVPTAYAPYVATIDLARGGDLVNDVPHTGNEFVGYVGPAVTSVTVASQGFVNLTDFVAPAVVPEPATWAMALIGFWSVAVAMRASRQRAFRSGA